MRKMIDKLTAAQGYALTKLVETDYLAQGLHDSAFAKYAAEKLGVPFVHHTLILARRQLLGIPSIPKPSLEASGNLFQEAIRKLEEEIFFLQKRVEVLEQGK